MSAKTKIVVLHSKEIIYTALFVLLGVLFVLLLISMFRPKDKDAAAGSSSVVTEAADTYVPGVYNTNLILKDQAVNVEVVVDKDHINSIRIVNLEESVATMYPLLAPTLDDLQAQIIKDQSLDNVTYPDDCRYTALVLLDTIKSSLDKAAAKKN